MIGPLTAVRRVTSTATGLATHTVKTGVSVATSAVQGALHLVLPGSGGTSSDAAPTPAQPEVPTPVRVPTEPDPAVKLARAAAKKAPAKKAPATKAPATKAPTTKAPSTKATPKPAPPKKKASEVPLKSDPTPASAAPLLPEGPDVLPGEEGATGLAEAQPLLDEGVAKAVLSEAETLRRAAE
jgi:hypothetical protein